MQIHHVSGRIFDFWLPSTKWQLVLWLMKHYSKDSKGNLINWHRFTKAKLTAIYIDFRTRMELRNAIEKENILAKEASKEVFVRIIRDN